MVTEEQFQSRGSGKIFILICAVTVVLCASVGDLVFAEERESSAVLKRYKFFQLKHISAEQGRKYLAEAQIGTVSLHPKPNTLLVTAEPGDLIKAGAVLKLVDVNEPFVIKAIFPGSQVDNLPSNEQIAAELGDVSIGTFSEMPDHTAGDRAIIDIHNNAVIAVAPAEQIGRIISAVTKLQEAGVETQAPRPSEPDKSAEPNQPEEVKSEGIIETESQVVGVATDANELEEDELFNQLLGTLAEAEKLTSRQVREAQAEPNEPKAIEAAPEQKVPIEPSAGSEEPQQVDIAAILKRLDALEDYAEPEQVVVETAQPSEGDTVLQKKGEMEPEVTEPVSKVGSYQPESISNGEDELTLDLPETVKIIDLLALVGEYLNLDYMYDPTQIQGEVTLKLRGKFSGPIKVKDLYPLLESVLKFKGLVMARKGNLVIIVAKGSELEIDPTFYTDDSEKVEIGNVIITRIFKLKHISAASAGNLLTGMKLGIDINTSISEMGTLIVTGYAYRMARIEKLLEMVDKPGEAKKFRFRQLEYTMAEKLVPKVEALAEQLGTISIAVTARAGRSAAQRPTTKRGARESEAAYQRRLKLEAARKKSQQTTKQPSVGEPAKPTVYLEPDERTNRILMIGLQEQLSIIDQLIDTLDVEQQDLRTLRLYDIQYVGAEEVEEKLQELGIISVGRETRGRATRTTARITKDGRPTTTAATTGAKEESPVEEPQVVIIESTNSLLVNATAEQHTRIATIIGYVDSEPEQAAINYIVYPLENQDPEELKNVLDNLIQETVTERTGKGDKDDKIVRTTTKRTEENIVVVADPSTYSLIVYASKKNQQWISSLIRQLDEYRPQVLLDVTLVQITKDDAFNFDLDLLSSIPDLAYTSGHTVGEAEQSIIDKLLADASDRNKFIDMKSEAGKFTGFYGDEKINALLIAVQTKKYGRIMARPKLLVNDNQEGTIETTDTTYIKKVEQSWTTGDNPVQTETITYPEYPAGITLKIKPHISTGDMLRLEITLNRSGFTSELTGEKPPDKADADVTTVVTIPNKSTIILGGMEKIQHNKGGEKVPFLGDIPLIGGAFRKVAKSGEHDKLYIFVKAHILRPGSDLALADLKEVSRENRETFEKLEQEMQKYEDWPGIKPEPMDPLKILEAD